MFELPVIFTIEQARRAGMRTPPSTTRSPVTRHALEARAAWLSLGRRGWASHYTAALLSELPVPLGQPDLVTLSQGSRSSS
jgi:hypothetical protein